MTTHNSAFIAVAFPCVIINTPVPSPPGQIQKPQSSPILVAQAQAIALECQSRRRRREVPTRTHLPFSDRQGSREGVSHRASVQCFNEGRDFNRLWDQFFTTGNLSTYDQRAGERGGSHSEPREADDLCRCHNDSTAMDVASYATVGGEPSW